jgi:hypothetical protein
MTTALTGPFFEGRREEPEPYRMPELTVPDEYNPRERKVAVRRNYIADNYKTDLGPMNEIRNHIYGKLAAKRDVPAIPIQGLVDEIKYKDDNKPEKGPRRPRVLPPKEGMDALFHVVGELKRDVKLIKDAQSIKGAEDWIVRNGYEKSLYVDARDFDGDGIPDIVVRTREGNKPYIIKGYTTDKSNYPDRLRYHTAYPLKENRKGHPMAEYLEEQMLDKYDDYGFTRIHKKEADEYAKRVKLAGYKAYHPKSKLSYIQAFKIHVFKPLLNIVKGFFKDMKAALRLPPLAVRQLEGILRDNIITIPVMKRIYDIDFQDDTYKQYWTRLTQRKEVRDGCETVTKYIIDHLYQKQVYVPMINIVLYNIMTATDDDGKLIAQPILDGNGKQESYEEVLALLLGLLDGGGYRDHTRLEREQGFDF